MEVVKLSKYSSENVQAIKRLDGKVQPLFLEFLWRIAMSNIYIRITSSYRSKEEQDRLYAQGRTEPGKIVTWVKGGWSFHNWGLAIDIVPLERLGPLYYKARYDKHWDVIAKIARDLGIDWGNDLWGFDFPHFHYSGGITLKQLNNGKLLHLGYFKEEDDAGIVYDIAAQIFFGDYASINGI